jgi:CheY-like chemotaxis protein
MGVTKGGLRTLDEWPDPRISLVRHQKCWLDWPGWCPRQDSNLRTRLRRPVLYPLSYEGAQLGSDRDPTRNKSIAPDQTPYDGPMPTGTVLVVDDDPVIVDLLRVNFEIEGYDVLTATGGEAGLAQASEFHPDVVVLDVMMPGIDGLEVARRLRQDPMTKDIPIILLSAKAQANDVQAGLAVADEYVTKPFEPLDLLERVGRAVQPSTPGQSG